MLHQKPVANDKRIFFLFFFPMMYSKDWPSPERVFKQNLEAEIWKESYLTVD